MACDRLRLGGDPTGGGPAAPDEKKALGAVGGDDGVAVPFAIDGFEPTGTRSRCEDDVGLVRAAQDDAHVGDTGPSHSRRRGFMQDTLQGVEYFDAMPSQFGLCEQGVAHPVRADEIPAVECGLAALVMSR